jgi:YVTN family beta-propeller protein
MVLVVVSQLGLLQVAAGSYATAPVAGSQGHAHTAESAPSPGNDLPIGLPFAVQRDFTSMKYAWSLDDRNPSIDPELGTVLTNFTSNVSKPSALSYDPSDGYVYALEEGSNAVSILNGTNILATIGVGTEPFALAISNVTGLVYVANYDSANVSVINGTRVVQSLAVGANPMRLMFDDRTGYLYVPNFGSNNVTVFNGSRHIANISVGPGPNVALYDPANGYIYVPAGNAPYEVDVLNGTEDIASFSIASGPTQPCVNPANGLVYLPLYATGILVINGTHPGSTMLDSGEPMMCSYDPENGYIYVTNYNGFSFSVVNHTRILANISIPTNDWPWASMYIPSNGYVYGCESGINVLAVINGTRIVGNITVGFDPQAFAYSPRTGFVYVADRDSDSISLISTELAISQTTAEPRGNPAGTLDIGDSVTFSATLGGVGTSRDTATWNSEPSQGSGCPNIVNFTAPTVTDEEATLSLNCTPTVPGNYTLWLIVTDTSGAVVSSNASIQVFTDPLGATPVPGGGPGVTSTGALIWQNVSFNENPAGGTGQYSQFSWTGLPPLNCTGLTSSSAQCLFSAPQVLAIRASFIDSNGRSAQSLPLVFSVSDQVVAGTVTSNRTSTDVGSSVTFQSDAYAIHGTTLSYSWNGLPPGCLLHSASTIACVTPTAGNYSVNVSVQDPWGAVATSSNLLFEVHPDPEITTPFANRSSLDAGQSVSFTAAVYGGSGGSSFVWHDLPTGCRSSSLSVINCVPTQTGVLQVWVSYNDSNGVGTDSMISRPVTVYSDTVVSTPTLSQSTVTPGTMVYLSVTVSGGSGNNSFTWQGLPPGCFGFKASVNCTPSATGNYEVTASALDSNGFRAVSQERSLIVANSTATSGLLLGINPLLFYSITTAIFIAVCLVILIRRRTPKTITNDAEAPRP